MTTQQFDQDRAEVFAERMLGVLNKGAIALHDQHRPPHRPLRRHGRTAALHQLPDRLGGAPRRALRARVVGSHGAAVSSNTIHKTGRTSCPRSTPPS